MSDAIVVLGIILIIVLVITICAVPFIGLYLILAGIGVDERLAGGIAIMLGILILLLFAGKGE